MPPRHSSLQRRQALGLIRALCLLAAVLLYSVSSQADDWIIEDQENYITLKKNGEIGHGNNIYFNFDKHNDRIVPFTFQVQAVLYRRGRFQL